MNNELSFSELFDRYLENDMNILERQDFELQLKNDPSFAERFRLYKEVDKALIEDDIINFRLQLERISNDNSELAQVAPMVIAEELPPEMDHAILEQDIMALRDQLNRIHTVVIEEVDPFEIPEYSGVERAILQQDSLKLNQELYAYEELVQGNGNQIDDESILLSHDIDRAIMQEDIMSLRATLNDLGNGMVNSKKKVFLPKRTYAITTAIAAVFVLLFATSLVLNQNSGSIGSERSFNKYFQSYDGIGNKRGPSEVGNRIVELGIQKYNKGEYSNALELFEACISDDNKTETVLLYAGSSALLTDNPAKALGYFNNWDEDSPIFEQVQWYTAGCYLKQKDFDKTKAILKKISEDPEHNYYNEAIELLKKI